MSWRFRSSPMRIGRIGSVMPVVFCYSCGMIAGGTIMAFFWKGPNLIPIDPDNVVSNDWIIILEANTIIDSSGKLRVAKTT